MFDNTAEYDINTGQLICALGLQRQIKHRTSLKRDCVAYEVWIHAI